MFSLHLIGVDHRGLGTTAREAIARSSCVFATERFRWLLGDFAIDILPISPLARALQLMATRLASADIVVLASGDPLFFGIGRTLIQRFGTEAVVIHPALSSMQLAFARCQEPWEDAAFISLHGRDDQDLLPTLMQRPKLFLLTDTRHPPQEIAAKLHRGLIDLGITPVACRIMVAENLGLADERISHGSPAEIAQLCFAKLNVMLIRLSSAADTAGEILPPNGSVPMAGSGDARHLPPPGPFGLSETEIRHSRGLISKDEVRAAILHRLRLPTGGVFWDIGAGSGSVSVEAARLCPGLTVYAIERHSDEQANIIANRKRFRLANLHLIAGPAPEALRALPAPDRVFIGGSGGLMPAIVQEVLSRLSRNGIIMASAVTEATRQTAPRTFHQHGLRVELTTIAINRDSYPPPAEGPRAQNPITLITGTLQQY